MLQWEVPTPKAGEPSWKSRPYWKRNSGKSENDISNAAQAAIRFARLGPVLVYCPTKADAVRLCNELIHLGFEFPEGIDTVQFKETITFIRERLLDGHPLVAALSRHIAFHHGDLPRDVRNEIEFPTRCATR